MRSTYKMLFYVNGSKRKNGIVTIMEKVTINGPVAKFCCKQNIHKELWDVKGKNKESRNINLALDNIKAQIIKRYEPHRISSNLLNIGTHDTINKHIKNVAKLCGIEKRTSFHLTLHIILPHCS